MTPADLAAMKEAVVSGDAERARRLAQAALAGGADLLAAVEQGFAQGIRRVGELWDEGEYFLPELVQGAEAMKAAMSVLLPALGRTGRAPASPGCVVIGTVAGDLHDIGKALVAVLLAAHGFDVHDLGTDVPVARFVEAAGDLDADVVAASALLTTTMPAQQRLVDAVAAAGMRRRPRVLVGGAPTTAAWAERIGAAHAENAVRAVAVARALVAR
jgi:corrinoid protein of di/trimethylamine methyltransferase